ncbi:MAG TPA: PIN domain-containing protein [Polyangiaceae bacterium]|nr:PIN domain-containing protein [Polyangiaceae bacterium]
MILVDTSAWIDFFRDRGRIADAVDTALESGEAALCGPVLTEIRRGLRAPQRRRVLPLLDGCHLLRQPEDLWLSAGDLGAVLARRGVTIKTLDLLIAVYAIAHGAPLLTTDGDFRSIARAGVGLSLAD